VDQADRSQAHNQIHAARVHTVRSLDLTNLTQGHAIDLLHDDAMATMVDRQRHREPIRHEIRRWMKPEEKERTRLPVIVECFHVSEFFERCETRHVQPRDGLAVLEVVTLGLDLAERYTAKTGDEKTVTPIRNDS
jgi:hypothetical protein